MNSNYWRRRARISRRRFIQAGAAATAGAAGLALAGCGDDGGKAGTSPAAGGTPTSEKITQGGTLRFPLVGGLGGPSPSVSLFPFESSFPATHAAAAFHYSRLLRPAGGPAIDPSDLTKLEGDLAAKWEQPDSLTYLFTLKPNVRWHDKPPLNGRLATATDFLNCYEAFAGAKAISTPGGPFLFQSAWTAVVDKITAPDDRTVRITMKAPYAPFLATRAASDRDFWLVPAETIDSGQVKKDPVGTGPYVFERFEAGVAITWRRHPAFHDAPLPNFDRAEAGLINDPQQIVAALQGGGYDLSGLAPSLYKESHALLDPQGTDFFPGGRQTAGFHFNFDNRPFNDLRVRQALSMAFDREGALKLQDATGRGNWCSFLPPGLAPYYVSPRDRNSEYGASGRVWNRNVKDARDLLKAATGSDTLRLKLVSTIDLYGPVWKQVVEIAADTIREAGFEAEPVYEPYASYITSTFRGKMAPESIGIGFFNSPRDPSDSFLQNYWSKSLTSPVWGGTPIAEQAELDPMFDKQRTILDFAERESYIKAIQYKMSESLLVVPIHSVVAAWTYTQPWLKSAYPTAALTGISDGLLKAYFNPERLKKG